MRQHILCVCSFFFFFFKQKTAYEMRISDWSSDVCSSDLGKDHSQRADICVRAAWAEPSVCRQLACHPLALPSMEPQLSRAQHRLCSPPRSEEHTSELQSLMRISYAVFCLKKKTNINQQLEYNTHRQTHIT